MDGDLECVQQELRSFAEANKSYPPLLLSSVAASAAALLLLLLAPLTLGARCVLFRRKRCSPSRRCRTRRASCCGAHPAQRSTCRIPPWRPPATKCTCPASTVPSTFGCWARPWTARRRFVLAVPPSPLCVCFFLASFFSQSGHHVTLLLLPPRFLLPLCLRPFIFFLSSCMRSPTPTFAWWMCNPPSCPPSSGCTRLPHNQRKTQLRQPLCSVSSLPISFPFPANTSHADKKSILPLLASLPSPPLPQPKSGPALNLYACSSTSSTPSHSSQSSPHEDAQVLFFFLFLAL